MIRALTRQAARRNGWAATAVKRQMRASIGTAIARRLARMSVATWCLGHDGGDVAVPPAILEDVDLGGTAWRAGNGDTEESDRND